MLPGFLFSLDLVLSHNGVTGPDARCVGYAVSGVTKTQSHKRKGTGHEEGRILGRMGVWARKQMEDRTPIGVTMLKPFYQSAKVTRARRRVGGPSERRCPYLKVADTVLDGDGSFLRPGQALNTSA